MTRSSFWRLRPNRVSSFSPCGRRCGEAADEGEPPPSQGKRSPTAPLPAWACRTGLTSRCVTVKVPARAGLDDMVILTEFFKFALNKLARDSHPGGTVDGRRDDQRKAWTEGVAEYFASDTLQSRYYVNSRPFGVYVVDDLEGMPSPYALSVKGAKLSPYLVSAFLWDLSDSNNEEWDPVDRMRNGIYDVLFTYFPSTNYTDRGAVGVDLGDFIDGWFCREWGADEEVRSLLVDHYDFEYVFDGPRNCGN